MHEERRATLDDVAELYERARPTYPDELFDDLVALTGLKPRSRVLEIGCGPGKATLPLAGRGLSRPGGRSAELDAVVAFTSFHWNPPELRYLKSGRRFYGTPARPYR